MAKDEELNQEYLDALKKIQEEENRIYGKQHKILLEKISSSDSGDQVFDTEEESLISDSEDPALCKKYYYQLMSIINVNIPKGKIREFVNNEKKVYLKNESNAGDSRFSYKNTLNMLLKIAKEWSGSDKNGFDLGMVYYELNEKKGYHKKVK